MRIVLDTNVLARVFCDPRGAAAKLFKVILSADHLLVLSPTIVEETRRVLGYERLRTRHGQSEAEIAQFLYSVESLALVVEPTNVPQVSNDADDDAVLGTAIAGAAEVLCTLDQHLRAKQVVEFMRLFDVRVMTDVELLQLLRSP